MRPAIHINDPWRNEFRATSRLAGPLALTQLAQFSLTLTDTVLIGRLGGDALAAVGLGSTLYIVVYLLCMGILAAVPPLAAQAHGARNTRLMRRTIRQGLWVATLLGLLSILALWPAEKIFLLLGQSPDIAIVSQEYVRAAVWGILPGLCVIAMRGFIAVMERPSFILAVTCTGFLVNGLADYALIFGVWGFPKLGVMGVGIATTVTNLVMCAAIMLIASKANRLRRYRVLGRFWRPDWSVFRDIFRVGTPITAMIMMEHMLFASATFMMGNLGTAEIAAHTIALNLAATSFMVPLGIGQAAVIRVGLAVGRKDTEGVRRAGWMAIGIGFLFMFFPALLFALSPQFLIGLFIDVDEPANAAVVSLGMSFLLIAALFQLSDGIQCIAAHVLRGLRDTRFPMMIAGVSYLIIGFPAAFYMAFKTPIRGDGVWWGLLIALGIVALLLTLRFHRLTKVATR